jgi:hypothetical protein
VSLRDWARVVLGIAAGSLAERLLEAASGTRLEYYQGLATFDWRWLLGISLWPLAGGAVCGFVIGRYGKWWAPAAAFLLRLLLWTQAQAAGAGLAATPVAGSRPALAVVPLGIWGFELLLCVDAAWVGGFLGERARRRPRTPTRMGPA